MDIPTIKYILRFHTGGKESLRLQKLPKKTIRKGAAKDVLYRKRVDYKGSGAIVERAEQFAGDGRLGAEETRRKKQICCR